MGHVGNCTLEEIGALCHRSIENCWSNICRSQRPLLLWSMSLNSSSFFTTPFASKANAVYQTIVCYTGLCIVWDLSLNLLRSLFLQIWFWTISMVLLAIRYLTNYYIQLVFLNISLLCSYIEKYVYWILYINMMKIIWC